MLRAVCQAAVTGSGREHVGIATIDSMSQKDVVSEAVFQTAEIKVVRGKHRATDAGQRSGAPADSSSRLSRVCVQNFLIPVCDVNMTIEVHF